MSIREIEPRYSEHKIGPFNLGNGNGLGPEVEPNTKIVVSVRHDPDGKNYKMVAEVKDGKRVSLWHVMEGREGIPISVTPLVGDEINKHRLVSKKWRFIPD